MLECHLTNAILSKPDPFKARASTLQVVKQAKLVKTNYQHLPKLANLVNQAIQEKNLLDQSQFGLLDNTPQKIFLTDTVNFCFWSPKNQPKWAIKYSGKTHNGWNALVASFNRASDSQIPVFDVQYLSNLTIDQTRELFRSSSQTPIPLIKKRQQFLKQNAQILVSQFNSNAENLIIKAKSDAPTLVKLIINSFPNFQDTTSYQQKPVYLYKRAQICAYDLSMLKSVSLKRLDQLTVFADYKLPQLFRTFKVITYHQTLKNKIDNLQTIPQNSLAETEIRATTIIVGELLSIMLQQPSYLIDNALWVLSQSKANQKPYHRTLSTCY
jgi:putative queuosine salvage protein